MISVKQGDTTTITVVLQRGGKPINLTTATAVNLSLQNQNGGPLLGGACTLGSGPSKTAGEATYQFSAADTETPGLYYAEWQITFPGSTETVPASGFETVAVERELVAPE